MHDVLSLGVECVFYLPDHKARDYDVTIRAELSTTEFRPDKGHYGQSDSYLVGGSTIRKSSEVDRKE